MTQSIRGAEFKRLFPHYFMSKFIVGESEVDFVVGENGAIITVDHNFFKNPQFTKFLGLSKQDQVYLRVHGLEKYKQYKQVKPEDDFQQRYQRKLDAQATESYWDRKEREDREQTIAREREWEKEWERQREFKAEQKLAAEQTLRREKAARDFQLDLKKWQPRLWSSRGTVPESIELNSSPIDFDFAVYVNAFEHFHSKFQKPSTKWKAKSSNILTEKFDVRRDPYFCSLGAAFMISYKAGFSKEHFETQGIAGSLAKYAVYFHLMRFLTFPNTLILSDNEIVEIQKKIPVKRIWKTKFVHTQEIPALWIDKQKNKANIKNIRADYYADGGGQNGIYYDEVEKVTNTNDEDWIKFIRGTSTGFTMFGQKLLQQAIESFCYAILGAQAKTRWKITGENAKASQTQDVFRQLVRDTIVELDSTKAISNMRTAIQDTNVVLNLVISPGVSLLPSNMTLGKKIPGFNNILTLANINMKFGKNEDVNKVAQKPSEQKPGAQKPSEQKPSAQKHVVESPESNTMSYVILGVAISLITKFIVYELL